MTRASHKKGHPMPGVEFHPVWAPEENHAERWAEYEAAHKADVQARSALAHAMAFARKRGITGKAALAFLARQRASLKRQRAREALTLLRERQPVHLVAHCGGWHPLDRLPCTMPCCGARILEAAP